MGRDGPLAAPAAADVCIAVSRAFVLGLWLLSSFADSHGELATFEEKGGEFCDTETFQATCAEDEAIVVNRALYGRMRRGRCVEYDLGYINCFSDVLTRMDRRCSGRRTCEIRIPDAEFESTGPCIKELKTYLEVGYYCVPVETSSIDHCSTHAYVNLTLHSGYVVGDLSPSQDRFACDHTLYPWVIAAHRGQQVNLTLYDFATVRSFAATAAANMPSVDEEGICRQYGWVEDSGSDRPVPICGGGERVRQIYLSRGNIVKIWTVAGEVGNEPKLFIIRYAVVGCGDPEILPHQTSFERNADGFASFRCQNSAELKWTVQCVDNTWMGPVGNCSVGLAIGIGAVIGVLIAVVIVFIIGCKSKPDRDAISQKRSSLPLNYLEGHYDKAVPYMKCSCGFVNQVVSSTLSPPTPDPGATGGGSDLVGVDPCQDYHHFGSAAHQPYCAQMPRRHFHETRDQLQQQQQQQHHAGITCPSDPGRRQMSDRRLWESQLAPIDSIPEGGQSQTAASSSASPRDLPSTGGGGGVFTVIAVPEVNSRLGAAGGAAPNTAFVSFVPLGGDRSPYAASATGFVVRQQVRSRGGGGGGGGEGGGEEGVGERKPKGETRISGGELKTVISDYGRRCVGGYYCSTPDKCSHKKQPTTKHQQQQQQQQFNL